MNPQTEREIPAIQQPLETIEWDFQAEKPLPQEPLELPAQEESEQTTAQVVVYSPPMPRPVVMARPVPVSEPFDFNYFLWVGQGVFILVRFLAPWAVLGAVGYGLFIFLGWLVQQTIFWVVLGGVAAVVLVVSAFAPGQGREQYGEMSRPRPQERPGTKVTTNIHVNGPGANVQTNIFVNMQNDFSDEND